MFGDKEGPGTRQIVAIDSVNPEALIATGLTRYGSRVTIALSMMWGGVLNIPALGDQWLVEKVMGQFVLVARVSFQDERRLLDLGPGDTVFGMKGTTHVFGSNVVVDSPAGISSGEVDLSDPPRITLSTSQPFSTGAGGQFDFENVSKNHSFESTSTSFTPHRAGAYQIMGSFYAPGFIRLNIGSRFRDFTHASSFHILEPITETETVSVEFSPDQEITPSSPVITASVSALWAGR